MAALPPIDFGSGDWLKNLLLYLASAWLAWLLGQQSQNKKG